MRRIAFVVLCSCVLVTLGSFVSPANAGGYGYDQVWYSASCCYGKVVRHSRSVRYVPAGGYGYGFGYGYVEPHRVVRVFAPPSPLLYDNAYIAYASFGRLCFRRQVTLDDGRGGWVWGVATTCY
jgi:hypothetical protein